MSNKDVISIIGLGYVGLPVAVAFAKKYDVIGFDINNSRIDELNNSIDKTLEVSEEELKSTPLFFTNEPKELQKANFHIVAVPTPIDDSNRPDLNILFKASETLGAQLKSGDIVVYESTVYPGVTEEECVPVLEKASGLKCGVDFYVGYSPERINPGDKEHTFTKITKVVSGQDEKTLEKVAEIYGSVVEAGVFKAQSIQVAEAAKVIENTQRDLNIAFMNELSIIFDKLNIDTKSVLEAASTKWNFLKFYPGLVGGHCIGVDPYYLTHKAQKVGYHPEVILSGRRINDSMGEYVVNKVTQTLVKMSHEIVGSEVNLLGLTFKENCPDIRNTRVLDIYNEFIKLGLKVNICDPLADQGELENQYGVAPVPLEDLTPQSILVLAVPHEKILNNGNWGQFVKPEGVFVDIKGAIGSEEASKYSKAYWRL